MVPVPHSSTIQYSAVLVAVLSVEGGVVVDVGVGEGKVVFVVQPDTNKEATTRKRTIIAVIGFNCIRFSYSY